MEKEVGACALRFEADELPGFEFAALTLEEEGDGELVATLVRKRLPVADDRTKPAVVYLHGFVDYFFQTWLAEAFEEAGYRFYALDLRRYGRSLRPGNRPNQARQISDYFTEIDWALSAVRRQHDVIASLVAHSTGALIGSLYLKHGEQKKAFRSFVCNSAFLNFSLGAWSRAKLAAVIKLARFLPFLKLPERISGSYGRTIHSSQEGEWDYDLSKKPLLGFPLYAGWFRMITHAHREVQAGLDLSLPILSLCSSTSRFAEAPASELDFRADVVLNVDDIRSLSTKLGSHVTVRSIPDGLHDLTLSRKKARESAISAMVEFVSKHAPT